MTRIAPVDPTELNQRRHSLRRQRRVRFFQSGWRNIAVLGLAVGAVWVATLPAWVIRKPEQVTIKGNQHLPEQAVRTLLPLDYPQSLIKIQPHAIAQSLKTNPTIADATVDRQLFPPSLTVRIQERIPVAVAVSKEGQAAASSILLDDRGTPIPLSMYTRLNRTFKVPTLRVSGRLEEYRSQWASFYEAMQRSPVKILEIDWSDSTNLTLKTELGVIVFGSYNITNFPNQLRALDQMRRLPSRIPQSQISHIDLSNPDAPRVQMNTSKTPVKLSTP